uniref:C2H2-type domain-containing protein n=1 Tax=Steinernema glaseri TaxID=37863 RepID=A0A1I7Z5D0_9BILA
MVIDKKNPCWWPRLTSAKRKCAWVKVDSSKWKNPHDEDVDDVSRLFMSKRNEKPAKRPKIGADEEERFADFVYDYLRQKKPELLKTMFGEAGRQVGQIQDNPLSSTPWNDDLRKKYGHFRRVTLAKLGGGKNPMWTCTFDDCTHSPKGRDMNVQLHTATHFSQINCPCSVLGCEDVLSAPSPFRTHLINRHKLPVEDMNSAENAKYKKVVKDFFIMADAVVYECFPPEAFIGFDNKERAKKVNPVCSECGEAIDDQEVRRTHVADHLDLEYKCVFEGCDYKSSPANFATHFYCIHNTTVRMLSEDQDKKYDDIKREYSCARVKVDSSKWKNLDDEDVDDIVSIDLSGAGGFDLREDELDSDTDEMRNLPPGMP